MYEFFHVLINKAHFHVLSNETEKHNWKLLFHHSLSIFYILNRNELSCSIVVSMMIIILNHSTANINNKYSIFNLYKYYNCDKYIMTNDK